MVEIHNNICVYVKHFYICVYIHTYLYIPMHINRHICKYMYIYIPSEYSLVFYYL